MSEQHQTAVGGVRVVALSRITPGEDFNPRTGRDPDRFAQLVASVKADGVLQPLLVTPEGDGFRIVAGEGRWLAAGEAGQTVVPVHVVDVDERTGGLELAMAENLARQDLDPVQEAHGYDRLRAAGLTKKGIAERLGIAQKRVTERLELLKLPEALHPQIASGQVPPAAIKPLVALERIHAGLAECAVARIDAPSTRSWEEPLTWADLVADPVNVLLASVDGAGCELPAGVYDASEAVNVAGLPLSDAAREQLTEVCELLGHDPAEATMQLGREALERATALKAAHATKSGWAHLIVGEDVMAELAADHVAAVLKQVRERADQAAAAGLDRDPGDASDAADESDAVSVEEQAKAKRRAEREQDEHDRKAAVAHNGELGSAILKHLPRLKVDADVLKILTTADLAGDLDGVAARGARYCFPGWATETAQKNGKVKVTHVDKAQAGARAREFLAGAGTMAEIAGRLVCLIAAARYADERCVARSNRSFSSLTIRVDLPYSEQVVDLIDELCAQRLPEHLTAPVREARREQREALATHEAELAAARERLDSALADPDALSDEQREQALADVDTVYGRYSLDGHRLRKQL
ncbi:MAG TPA: ParB/RepB/Spo0J family partition protein [Solirubrobacteraceae bacterium]|nr:ParB/RepB/Spo0J family partition protein [Solirubrobacteraceae bacterium]